MTKLFASLAKAFQTLFNPVLIFILAARIQLNIMLFQKSAGGKNDLGIPSFSMVIKHALMLTETGQSSKKRHRYFLNKTKEVYQSILRFKISQGLQESSPVQNLYKKVFR